MVLADEILILHLSDLHFGAYSRFSKQIEEDRCGQLGRNLAESIMETLQLDQPAVHLVAVTGDVAQTAEKIEYQHAAKFLEGLSGGLGLPRDRFVFCPGNHDVSWAACKMVCSINEYEGWDDNKYRQELNDKKLERYTEFLNDFYGDNGPKSEDLPGNGHIYDFDHLSLSIAALNSCERESHLEEDHLGEVGGEQLTDCEAYWRQPHMADRLKIACLHHNPDPDIVETTKDWKAFLENKKSEGKIDEQLFQRFLADAQGLTNRNHLVTVCSRLGVQMVLSGHCHSNQGITWPWQETKGNTVVLAAGSLGLEPDRLPPNQPNLVQVIRFALSSGESRVHCWRYDPIATPASGYSKGAFVPDGKHPAGRPYSLTLPFASSGKKVLPPKPTSEAADDPTAAFLEEYRRQFKHYFKGWDLSLAGIALERGQSCWLKGIHSFVGVLLIPKAISFAHCVFYNS